jgi:hypothetical protein
VWIAVRGGGMEEYAEEGLCAEGEEGEKSLRKFGRTALCDFIYHPMISQYAIQYYTPQLRIPPQSRIFIGM